MWFCRQVPQPDRPPSLSSLSRTETLSSSPSPHAHTSLGLAPAPIHAAFQCSLLFLRGGPCPPLSSVPFAPPRGSRSQGARARRRRIGRQRRRWIWQWWSRRRLHSPGTGQIRPTSFTGATPSATSHGGLPRPVSAWIQPPFPAATAASPCSAPAPPPPPLRLRLAPHPGRRERRPRPVSLRFSPLSHPPCPSSGFRFPGPCTQRRTPRMLDQRPISYMWLAR